MRRVRLIGAITLSACITTSATWGAEALETRGTLDAVTVYRGQALVTRVIEIAGPPGLREIVVTDLPEHAIPESLYAESSGQVEVRSVLFRERAVMQDVREEVRKIDDQIRALGDLIAANQQRVNLLNERRVMVEKLEQFTAPTASVELTKGVLDPKALKDMADYLSQQRQSISEDDLKFRLERRDLDEQMVLLQRQRQEVAGASARTSREALIFANVIQADARLELRYLVNNASWTPSYSVRAADERDDVVVEYYASIQQGSGENWADVQMTLSTATPSLASRAPMLEPLQLSLASMEDEKAAQYAKGDFWAARKELVDRQQELEQSRGRAGVPQSQTASGNPPPAPPPPGMSGSGMGGGMPGEAYLDLLDANIAFDKSLNAVACDIQLLELANNDITRDQNGQLKFGREEAISVTYLLPSRTSLPSRADRQLVQIASLPMDAEFYRLASPVLTRQVYEEALVTNTSDLVLLAGPVASYVAGEFVGHGNIPTIASGESFTVGLGIDSSLRASRELLDKSESIQGGNRVVELSYRLTIENFNSHDAAIRLMDRMPMSKGADVKVTLVNASADLSDDTAYRSTDHKKGLLRWDLDVPQAAKGTEAVVVDYQLRVEYDKQMSVTGLAMATP
jgi:hypothetical protein